MNRILVLGCGGAGKSSFSVLLGEKLDIPVIHLDAYYWKDGWVESSREEFLQSIEPLSSESSWIMDGNYGGTLDIRMKACDTVIFLDRSRALCLWRIFKRRIQFHGRTRPDIAINCPERLTLEFIRYVWSYPRDRRPKLLDKLQTLKSDKTVLILNSEKQIFDFLGGITL